MFLQHHRHRHLVARLFDDFRRSTALRQLLVMYSEGLVRDEEMSTFSEGTEEQVRTLRNL